MHEYVKAPAETLLPRLNIVAVNSAVKIKIRTQNCRLEYAHLSYTAYIPDDADVKRSLRHWQQQLTQLRLDD